MAEFQWPWQYNFPPFFTLQPNLNTRKKQFEAWRSLILSYHKFNKQYTLDVIEAQNSPPFSNESINRKLPIDALYIILEDLRQRGNCEWLDKQRKRCYIYWRTPEEWGKQIYNWASTNGLTNTVCTLFEITKGDDTVEEDFYGLDSGILIKALQSLEMEQKAELISMDESEGVKFF